MNMTADQLFLLSVGVQPPPESSEWISIQRVCSARDAITELRFAKVDLLLAGPAIADMTMWKLIEKIRAARPAQKWAMIDPQMSRQTEIRARSLGAMFVCHSIPDGARLYELAHGLMKKPACVPMPAVLEMN
jgi:hypothetical protein